MSGKAVVLGDFPVKATVVIYSRRRYIAVMKLVVQLVTSLPLTMYVIELQLLHLSYV